MDPEGCMYDGHGRRDGKLMGLRVKGKDALPVSLSLRPQSGVKPLTFRPPSLSPSLSPSLPPFSPSRLPLFLSIQGTYRNSPRFFARLRREGGRKGGRDGGILFMQQPQPAPAQGNSFPPRRSLDSYEGGGGGGR